MPRPAPAYIIAGEPFSVVIGFSILGFASGLKSIVNGTLPLALFGRTGYATRLGRMASIRLVLAAIAPFVLAYLMQMLGPSAALLIIAACGLPGLLAFVEVARLQHVASGSRH